MDKKELGKLRERTVEALQKEVVELQQQRDRTLADMASGKESNLKKARFIKKDIAQYLTILNEKTKNK